MIASLFGTFIYRKIIYIRFDSLIHFIINKMLKLFLILTIIINLTQSRYFETSFKFSLLGRNRGWMYIDKMTFAPGTARV